MRRAAIVLLVLLSCDQTPPRERMAARDASAAADSECGDAGACLRAAAARLGSDPDVVERLSARGCRLDPHASYRGLSCQFFDRATFERAARLTRECRAMQAGACRGLGDVLSPFDQERAHAAYTKECALGGLGATCARFLAFLATPPRCPPPRPALSYGRCPSEAKSLPRQQGQVAFEDRASPVARALEASQGFRRCYTAALVTRPKLGGRVELHLTVDRLGRFMNVDTTGSELDDPLALECFVREAAELSIDGRLREPSPEELRFVVRP
ncbi:MAG: hypothetical protein KC776_38555 [Myxococcales bacterium]|nr:hypothetical protein [Myxococcales bacterium]MCB9576223.1 hypothetical protein [Polyangiaceae bacterium]